MGERLAARVSSIAPQVPQTAFGLLSVLARMAHDEDEQPCVWANPETLTRELFGVVNDASLRRFRRRIELLIEAKLIVRAGKPHTRSKRRTCPRDARKFHVELTSTVVTGRPLNAADSGRSASSNDSEIVDAERPVNPGDSGRSSVEIVDVSGRDSGRFWSR